MSSANRLSSGYWQWPALVHRRRLLHALRIACCLVGGKLESTRTKFRGDQHWCSLTPSQRSPINVEVELYLVTAACQMPFYILFKGWVARRSLRGLWL